MLPALPTGIASASIGPSSSAISIEAVFWPSSRYGLTEFTSAIGCRWTSSRTSVSASSKLPGRRRHRAGHPAVLERSGRVRALELEPHLAARPLGHPLGEDQRGRPLRQR